MAIIKLSSAKISSHIGINYVTNPKKTTNKLISGVNCMPESCHAEFEMVKERFNKHGGRNYYHLIQSFAEDDKITPEKAHEIGLQMSEHCFHGYQVLVATHIDKKHTHNHLIINSVSYKNGKKVDISPNDLIAIKQYSNQLCKQNGLIFTEPKTRRNEKPKWKQRIIEEALYAMSQSYTMEEYIGLLKCEGISIKYNKDYKYMTYTDMDGHRCRDAKLFDERLLKKNLELYFELGGADSRLSETITEYQTSKTGNCTDGLTNLIFDILANLIQDNHDDNWQEYETDEKVLDDLIEKMRAHGLRITKSQLAHIRNSHSNQNQSYGLTM